MEKEEVMGMARSGTVDDRGFTLVEMVATLSITGIMSGLAITAFSTWKNTSEHRAARDEVVSTLRLAAERSLSEQRTYCVHYGTSGWTTYRLACGPTGTLMSGPIAPDSVRQRFAASLVSPSGAESACPTAGACAYFYPRGNASAGTVVIKRDGQSDYTVTIVGLTSRVFVS